MLSAVEPLDRTFGWHFDEPEVQKNVLHMINKFRPHVIHIAYPCTWYNIFNENLNYSHRLHELKRLRWKDKSLRQFIRQVVETQIAAARCFLIPELQAVGWRSLPTCSTSMGSVCAWWTPATTAGTTWKRSPSSSPSSSTNIPGAATRLSRQLQPDEKLYTVPVEGKHTQASQVYRTNWAFILTYQNYVRTVWRPSSMVPSWL